MKLYAFTEQGLKDLLDQYATNIFMDIKNDSKEGRTIELNTLYPAFPEPIDLPDGQQLRIESSKRIEITPNHTIIPEKDSFVSGANHIITLIKNGLK